MYIMYIFFRNKVIILKSLKKIYVLQKLNIITLQKETVPTTYNTKQNLRKRRHF